MPGKQNSHVAQFDFARFLDDELSASEREALLAHVNICDQCAKELSATEQALATLPAVIRSATSAPQYHRPSSEGLHANLSSLAAGQRPSDWRYGILQNRRYMSYAALVLMIGVSIGVVVHRRAHQVGPDAVLLPKRDITPGAVRSVALAELCQVTGDDDDLDPVVSVPVQKAVFSEYGISPEQSRVNFQMDYLINPQLGGVNDVRNLWPQPYSSEWNARAKDELERHLHQMVCEHKIELADAQHEIAENWIDAYKKYFHTSKPI